MTGSIILMRISKRLQYHDRFETQARCDAFVGVEYMMAIVDILFSLYWLHSRRIRALIAAT